jgi:hypothetical protein
MRGRRGFAICWLTPEDPGPFDDPFCAVPEDLDRLQQWTSVLLSGQALTPPIVQHIVDTYDHIRMTNAHLFEFQPQTNPTHADIQRDVRSLFSLLRAEVEIPPLQKDTSDVDALFVRILLY